MEQFNYHQTTKILFGKGRVNELPEIVKNYGKKVMLVTTKATIPALEQQYKRVISILTSSGIDVIHYDDVVPNPTINSVDNGGRIARDNNVDVIIGLGGGSSMDTAKAISVVATHPGSCWDYLFYKNPQLDNNKLLPIIAITTTSGTGSHVTQVAVITNPTTRDKSAIFNNIIYPLVSIIDPELMLSLPLFVTATTGFDVLCHAFESAINVNTSPYINIMSWEAISIVVENLPCALKNLNDIKYREKMAYADLLGGLCIANAGVTLPHGMGMAISGMYPHVVHGESLSIVYPAFAEFTWPSAIEKFAKLTRILNLKYNNVGDVDAASHAREEIISFLQKIGLHKSLRDVNMPEEEIELLANQCMVLPDYKANPRVATKKEMLELVKQSY